MNHYLVLISLSKPNKITAEKIVSNLKTISAEPVTTAWIDSAYIGIPIACQITAGEIWKAAINGINETADLRDMLIVEIGRDWMGRQDARASHWLSTHLGIPLRAQR